MSRHIKYFGGQHLTLPMKDVKDIHALLFYLLNKVERSKTQIKEYQADRNYMFILIGLNTAFRAEDLLQLRVCDLNGYISIKENKTGKMQNFRMNSALMAAIKKYVERWELSNFDYMFKGQKKVQDGKPYSLPITRIQAYKIVNQAGQAIGLRYTFGLHSLRKTFGYQYIKNGGKLLTLQKMYNHDSPDVTLRYVMWGTDDAEAARAQAFIGVKDPRN